MLADRATVARLIKSKPIYSPIPARAVADNRLHGFPLRVLAAVALRDRMSVAKGGKGCFASNDVLCIDCRCNEQNLSRAISDLVELGYLVREGNQRSRVLRVVYTAEDEAIASRKSQRVYRERKTGRRRDYHQREVSLSPEENDFIKIGDTNAFKSLADKVHSSTNIFSREPLRDSLKRNGNEVSGRIEPEHSEEEYDNGFDDFPGSENYRGVDWK